ncbi:MAG: hypothetical protein ACO22O_08850 [bacterium]
MKSPYGASRSEAHPKRRRRTLDPVVDAHDIRVLIDIVAGIEVRQHER